MTKTAARSAPDPTLRRRADDWATEVAAWKRSGQTAEAYARGRQMHPSTLRWWASRLAREASTGAPTRSTSTGAEVTFLPLRVVAPTPAPSDAPSALQAEVVLVGGRSVRLRGELTIAQLVHLLFWDRNGFCLVRKRLEAGTFRLAAPPPEGATHVAIDAASLLLLLEGIELAGATRRKRYRRDAA